MRRILRHTVLFVAAVGIATMQPVTVGCDFMDLDMEGFSLDREWGESYCLAVGKACCADGEADCYITGRCCSGLKCSVPSGATKGTCVSGK